MIGFFLRLLFGAEGEGGFVLCYLKLFSCGLFPAPLFFLHLKSFFMIVLMSTYIVVSIN